MNQGCRDKLHCTVGQCPYRSRRRPGMGGNLSTDWFRYRTVRPNPVPHIESLIDQP
jgi:hypothetical protein